jgi:hypothetical protein
MLCVLTTKFRCLQEIPPSDLVDQGDEGDWETVGEPAERSRSSAPTMPEAVPQAPVAEGRAEPVAAAAAEEPTATEAGLVDIASIFGAPTVTIVRSIL